LPFAYAVWIANNEKQPGPAEEARSAIGNWSWRPRFSIAIHSGSAPDEISRSLASLEQQIYPCWTLSSSRHLHEAISKADGDFVVPLRAGDELSRGALLRFAETLRTAPEAAILYGDQDRIDARGRRSNPWFKPCWNEELFLAQDYLSSAVAIRSEFIKRAAANTNDDLAAILLNATSSASERIVHIPHILVHTGAEADPAPGRLDLVARHLAAKGAACVPGPYGTVKVEWPLPEPLPLVSIIIPTRDKLDVLRPCVESLLKRTEYPNFEILIIDNGSIDAATAKFFREVSEDERVRVLTYDRPFNYSAINNFAVGHARGTFVALLNNDTEVLEPAWLTELMRYAARPEIGAAGAKLLYDDRSIQHAGVVIGIGGAAGHAHRFLPADQPGYFYMPHVAQFVSAVTGACLLVKKSKFEAVGGLDDEKLAIAFNDVDFCLKLEVAGWRNVYVPHAILLHHESKSRDSDMAPTQLPRFKRELAVLQERWGTKTYKDPLHNPNLDSSSETYVFRV
jgi:GT2 family glycosyltransferase